MIVYILIIYNDDVNAETFDVKTKLYKACTYPYPKLLKTTANFSADDVLNKTKSDPLNLMQVRS